MFNVGNAYESTRSFAGLRNFTIFERNQALVRDFKLKGVQKSRGIIQNSYVCDVDNTHLPETDFIRSNPTAGNNSNETLEMAVTEMINETR